MDTKERVITESYKHQRAASRNRNYELPDYTLFQLKDWALNQKIFHTLYDNWVKSGCLKDLKPSIDRIDDYKSYAFGNIQLITWKENREKGFRDKKNGVNRKQLKSVLQYDLDGNFIKEHYSIHQAGRETKTNFKNISSVCHKRYKTAGGFVWKFKD